VGSAGRADCFAGTAILAFGRVNYKQTINLRNSAFGAFRFASAALDAFFTNYVSHDQFLSVQEQHWKIFCGKNSIEGRRKDVVFCHSNDQKMSQIMSSLAVQFSGPDRKKCSLFRPRKAYGSRIKAHQLLPVNHSIAAEIR
jgi:hypothetical protein